MGDKIQFALSYIVVPIIITYGIIDGKIKNKLQQQGQMLMIKGFFYFYLAVSTLFNFFELDASYYVSGFTVALAIVEGGTAIYDGYMLVLKNARMKFGVKEETTKND